MEMATVDDVKAEIREQAAEEKKASGKMSFLGSIVTAVEEHPEDAAVLLDAATKLQDHTKKLKTYVATLDATACHAAMRGGMLGIGCDDEQLIAATCTRTKAQLARTIKRCRAQVHMVRASAAMPPSPR